MSITKYTRALELELVKLNDNLKCCGNCDFRKAGCEDVYHLRNICEKWEFDGLTAQQRTTKS